MTRKADKDELRDLEAKLLEKMNEIMQRLMGIFADKKDTIKRLTNLEKNVNSLP
jgi:hypothetical protein